MKDFLKQVRVEHFLWGVVIAKLASDRSFPWGAVPVILFLLAKPLVESYVARVALRRDAMVKTAETLALDFQALDRKLTETQNRLGSLSLAAGLKRQGP